MIVMGIDPGLATTGIGIVDATDRNKPLAVDWLTLETPAKVPLELRLTELAQDLRRLLDEHQPDLVVIEQLFFSTNVKTAIVVAQARGALLAEVGARGVPVLEAGPIQMKSALTGDGQADKRQVQQMLQHLFRLDSPPSPDDAADALGLALYGAFHRPLH